MEAAVLTDPEIKAKIDNDFVMVTLMVDDNARKLPAPITVKESDGQERVLETYGDKWSYLQRTKFGANAQPYYVILNDKGQPLNFAFPYEEDVPKFKKFLEDGLNRYNDPSSDPVHNKK